MPRQSIFDMPVSRVYPLLVQKAEKKGRTKEEVDTVIRWLTGHEMSDVDQSMTYREFFESAPRINPAASLITGSICGVRVEEIEDPLMQNILRLDKLFDELAKGKPMEKIRL